MMAMLDLIDNGNDLPRCLRWAGAEISALLLAVAAAGPVDNFCSNSFWMGYPENEVTAILVWLMA